MNMKRISLFALLLIVAVSANAYVSPKPYQYYRCYYSNYHGNAKNGGQSIFQIQGPSNYLQGIEVYDTATGTDNQKVTFAEKMNIFERDPDTHLLMLVGTQWEFTINPVGPQCKNTVVWADDGSIDFANCTDGSSRTCYPL